MYNIGSPLIYNEFSIVLCTLANHKTLDQNGITSEAFKAFDLNHQYVLFGILVVYFDDKINIDEFH